MPFDVPVTIGEETNALVRMGKNSGRHRDRLAREINKNRNFSLNHS